MRAQAGEALPTATPPQNSATGALRSKSKRGTPGTEPTDEGPGSGRGGADHRGTDSPHPGKTQPRLLPRHRDPSPAPVPPWQGRFWVGMPTFGVRPPFPHRCWGRRAGEAPVLAPGLPPPARRPREQTPLGTARNRKAAPRADNHQIGGEATKRLKLLPPTPGHPAGEGRLPAHRTRGSVPAQAAPRPMGGTVGHPPACPPRRRRPAPRAWAI